MKTITDKEFFEAVDTCSIKPLSDSEIDQRYGYLMQDIHERLSQKYPKPHPLVDKAGSIVIKLLKPLQSFTAAVSQDIQILTAACGTMHPAVATRSTQTDKHAEHEDVPSAMAFEREGQNCKCRMMAEYKESSLNLSFQITSPDGMPLVPFNVTAVDENNTVLLSDKRFESEIAEINGVEPGLYEFTLKTGNAVGAVEVAVE